MSRKQTPLPLTVKTPDKHIGMVNFKLATACIAGGAAYLIWPNSSYWWGLYPISIVFAMAALINVVEALRLFAKIRKFESDQAAFERLGNPVKKATLAEEDFLTKDRVVRHVK